MSVPEQVPYKEYRATGSNNSFEITFYLPDPKDLVVMVNKEIPLVGAYSIQGNTVVFSTPPNEGDLVELTRDTQLDRETEYKSYDNSFRPETINFDLDKIWLVLQESNLVDAKILARLKQEIEWRRTHDFNYDELAQVREKQLFDALKGYTDTLLASTNPGVFQGVIAGVVFAQDGKSIQTHIEEILDTLVENREAINSKAGQEYVDEQLALKAPQENTYTKIEVDSALSTKAPQETTYTKLETDAKFSAYAGGRKGYTTLALAQADQANLPVNTVVDVTNDPTVSNNGTYQWNGSTLTKSSHDPLTSAKNYTDSYATVKSKALADATNFNNVTEEGQHRIVSNASALTMTNCPSPYAGVLEVLPVSPTLLIQRYTPYGINKKTLQRASNAGVWPAAWEEVLFKSEADTLYATPSAIGAANSATVSAITQIDYYGKKYSTAEQNGSSLYVNGVYAGYNSTHEKDIIFNALDARIFNASSAAVEYRVYMGSKVTVSQNGNSVASQAAIAAPDFSGVCPSFPKSDNGQAQTVMFDKAIVIPKNTPFVIVFKAIDLTRFSIAHAATVNGNLENRSFSLSQVAEDWNKLSSIGNASPSLGYVQAGFKLLIKLPQSSGGTTPGEAYLPSLVMPPKLYAMQRTKVDTEPKVDQTLETRIYPEHLLVEDYKLYEHDVTCTRGQQRNRGFVWSATQNDPAGSYPLTWALHDKQKGLQLASASTTIQLAALNAKSGQTVKALVIGDSLVNAGSITQRLLDIAADDVMKVQLIGTRGTGLNKHEGRGGWKIEDYAGAGRSNYKFTVSGVVTPPAINSTTYTFGTATYLVQEVALTGGSGTIIASLWSGTPPATPSGSGNLTKANTGVGDATIAFSNFEGVPGNPFWNAATSKLDFANYLSYNSLAAPDYVFIQLGVNDVFGLTSDQAVVDFTVTAFAQLDSIIAAIKAAMPSAKIAVAASPVGANQDAFGTSYACGQTAWRYRRNLVMYNKQLYVHYAGKEGQNIYVLGSGVGVDTENNFPTTVKTINSHNSKTEDAQSNGVHPDKPGYNQISDGWFPFMKAT
ncbi:hypothetical protein [Acinetobacter sp.]|uniref:hypothetical protein n=1 Tax=Acinetobacter sp. TaxID=472 RepID=UPI00289A6896|nr:hypothetical protein [Acinetobacter sp.]